MNNRPHGLCLFLVLYGSSQMPSLATDQSQIRLEEDAIKYMLSRKFASQPYDWHLPYKSTGEYDREPVVLVSPDSPIMSWVDPNSPKPAAPRRTVALDIVMHRLELKPTSEQIQLLLEDAHKRGELSATEHFVLGRLYLTMDYYDLALAEYEAASKDTTLEKESLYLASLVLLRTHRYTEAQKMVEQLVKRPPLSIDSCELAARIHEKCGQFRTAYRFYMLAHDYLVDLVKRTASAKSDSYQNVMTAERRRRIHQMLDSAEEAKCIYKLREKRKQW